MPFYHFRQNNTGGSFDYDRDLGITVNVVIEGDDADDITERAAKIGLYWDGCQYEKDCPCCGDRWSRPWAEHLDEHPMVYGEPVGSVTYTYGKPLRDGKNNICVHFADGRMEWYP